MSLSSSGQFSVIALRNNLPANVTGFYCKSYLVFVFSFLLVDLLINCSYVNTNLVVVTYCNFFYTYGVCV